MPKRIRSRHYDRLIPIADPVALENYSDSSLIGRNSTFPTEFPVKWNQQIGRHLRGPQPLRPRSDNGRNDPYSIMCVLDALLRLDHRSFITGLELTGQLETDYPWIRWDPYTVGRILHSIAEIANENASGIGARAFWITKSNGLRNYIPPQDIYSWHWLGVLREKAGLEAEKDKFGDRDDTIWELLSETRWGTHL